MEESESSSDSAASDSKVNEGGATFDYTRTHTHVLDITSSTGTYVELTTIEGAIGDKPPADQPQADGDNTSDDDDSGDQEEADTGASGLVKNKTLTGSGMFGDHVTVLVDNEQLSWGGDPDGPGKTKEQILQEYRERKLLLERAKEALENADPEDVAWLQQIIETQENILAILTQEALDAGATQGELNGIDETETANAENNPIDQEEWHGDDPEAGGDGDSGDSSWLDNLQTTLDVAGFIPGVGAIPDVANAGISLLRGNFGETGINLLAAVPGAGDGFKAVKMGKAGLEAVGKAGKVAAPAITAIKKSADTLAAGVSKVRKKLPRYNGPKPRYTVNPAHEAATLGRNKTLRPDDAAEIFRRAVPDDPVNARHWFGQNADGQIYRFSNSNDGTVHFSGIDGVGDGIRNLTRYAKERLKELGQ